MNSADNKPLRLIFAGTPEFAASHLQTLIDSTHNVVAVYSQPDRPAGRGRQLTASPVKQLALQHNLEVLQPLSLSEVSDQQQLADFNADLMVVVAYGLLLPKVVLDTPHFGCINVHASLLPRWRGAAPIQRAIEAGDETTGITVMQMDVGLDTGDMLFKNHCDIAADETGASLHDKLIPLGQQALLRTLEQLQHQKLQAVQQNDDESCYASKLAKQEALIDWHLPANIIEQKIRAFNSWPVAYSLLGNHRIRIWQASATAEKHNKLVGTILTADKAGFTVACGDQQVLQLLSIQLPGKKILSAAELLNSNKPVLEVGHIFSSEGNP